MFQYLFGFLPADPGLHGLQTTRSVERNIEPAAEIKEPVTSERRERLAIILSLSLRELRV